MSEHAINIDALHKLHQDIKQNSPHPDKVKIIAVTKTQPFSAIISAIKNGIQCIGENKVQEFETKQPELSQYKPTFKTHLIGHLQSNKINRAIKLFNIIETVDSLSLAQKINNRLRTKAVQQEIYIQINIGGDPNKYGFPIKGLFTQIEKIEKLENIIIGGVMTILPYVENVKKTQTYFKEMKKIQTQTKQKISSTCVNLSMGMSRDYIYALREGATHIRIGTKLYGQRK